ncbi:MAG TPA: histidine phosphatase family protein [Candidatus Hydrogenedentes bacterium]|nr:histidine phosphatase family protein [Candidatus Hydrogenedentota bacterium]HRK33448.1 histidine phosphatase family protein [Candidatus Hydrogenedentota bacterium]
MGTLIIVRHGQASFHEEDYDKLSPLGEEQARRLGKYWAEHGVQLDKAISGPLRRQRRSAELVREEFEKVGGEFPEIVIDEALAEMPAERLAKRFMPQLCAEDAECLALVQEYMAAEDKKDKERLFQKPFEKMMLKWASKEYHDEEIETFENFIGRVRNSFHTIISSSPNGQRVAAFTSGGPTAIAMHLALNTSFESTMELIWQIRNASLTEFMFTEGRFTLSTFNNVAHLRDPEMWTYR